MQLVIGRDLEIRGYRGTDEGFVYGSWLKHYWDIVEHDMRKSIFMQYHHKVIEGILERGSVRVACSSVDDDQIIGYMVIEGSILHYVYVKSPFRKSGVCKLLVKDVGLRSPLVVTHKTTFLPYLRIATEYNPYLRYTWVEQRK